ncbi:MAG: peptide deformylase [Candidatus Zixiibacteriota bacterium]|nr:MAG: peptide deformylase [candidate division Zixibacteria bacterium]
MAVKDITQLGNRDLYKISEEVLEEEMPALRPVIADMHDTVMDFRIKHGFGRAIAAPQIGLFKRLVYMFTDQPEVFINPVLSELSPDLVSVWDNCMSFPQLLVKVKRHKTCTIRYRDLMWREKTWQLKGDMSELLQHEVDHLDGILATQRAVDDRSFALRGEQSLP